MIAIPIIKEANPDKNTAKIIYSIKIKRIILIKFNLDHIEDKIQGKVMTLVTNLSDKFFTIILPLSVSFLCLVELLIMRIGIRITNKTVITFNKKKP